MPISKITYNAEDYTGESHKLVIKPRSFKSSNGLAGKYKTISFKDIGERDIYKVDIEGCEITVFELDAGFFYCEDMGISRSSWNPIVAALKLAHNII